LTQKEHSPIVSGKRRGGISSEPFNPLARYEKRVIPKSKEAQERLQVSLKKNILFKHLEEDERISIVDAMAEVIVPAGTTIIRQGSHSFFFLLMLSIFFLFPFFFFLSPWNHHTGDEGDNFYVIGEGDVDVFVSKDGGEAKYVCTIGKDGSFGELALIYGSPRAATVKVNPNTAFPHFDFAAFPFFF
jgi:cAMP-dependent protein kinase regulator